MCPDCGRAKMLFETEKEAQTFIKFNGQELIDDVSKLRVYYCPACCGYHISSHGYKGGNRTEKLIKAYYTDKHFNNLELEGEVNALLEILRKHAFQNKKEAKAYLRTLSNFRKVSKNEAIEKYFVI